MEATIWNPAICCCENGKYLGSIIDDSLITCDEIVDAEAKSNDKETKTVSKNFNKIKQTAKHKISIFDFHFINYYRIINIC